MHEDDDFHLSTYDGVYTDDDDDEVDDAYDEEDADADADAAADADANPALSKKDIDIMVIGGLAKQVMEDLNELRAQMVTTSSKVKEIQKRIDGIQKEDRKAMHEVKRYKPSPPAAPSTHSDTPHTSAKPSANPQRTRLSAQDIKRFRSIIDNYKLRLENAGCAMDLVHVSQEPKIGPRTPGLSPEDAKKERTRLRYQFKKDYHAYFKKEEERLRMLCDKRKA